LQSERDRHFGAPNSHDVADKLLTTARFALRIAEISMIFMLLRQTTIE